MRKFLVLLTFITSFTQAGYLPSGAELFILKANDSQAEAKLYVRSLNLARENTYGWISYDKNSPNGKIFDLNPVDKLTFATDNIKKAFYLVLTKETYIEEDQHYISDNPHLKKRMDENLYRAVSDYLPISNANVEDVAQDLYLACPKVPSRKNGKPCHQARALKLPSTLKLMLKNTARKYSINPVLLASIIQHESLFDVFVENMHEKNKCLANKNKCSPYKWGKGLAQLGATDAHFFGLNWNQEIGCPRACKGKNILDVKCLDKLVKKCERYKAHKLRPINCPGAAIEAVAKKLKSLIPDHLPVWVKKSPRSEEVELVNLSSFLKRSEVEKTRNLIGLYNRGVKVYNSFVEFYDKHGEFPLNFGQAWSTARSSRSPSISMGYQMLTREYIGRCYVYELAGICGEMPKHALVKQFEKQF
jgi:hypothetical protein